MTTRSWLRRAILAVAMTAALPAIAQGASISLAWDASPTAGVAGYTVDYGTASGVYTISIDVGNVTSYTVTGLAIGTQYYFVVKAYSAAGNSPYSNEVSGLPPSTDTTTVSPGTPVLAIHITDLRARIDHLRMINGLAAQSWTDPALGPGTVAKAVHITEMRSALAAVYTKLNRTVPTYTDSSIVAGATYIKAVHISELRAAVAALE